MASDPIIVFPGDPLPASSLPAPSGPSGTLKLGPHLAHAPPATITPTTAGTLHADAKKGAVWVEHGHGRVCLLLPPPPTALSPSLAANRSLTYSIPQYLPAPHDPVLATVQRSTADAFLCSLAPRGAPALLPHLAFPHASRKTRPQLPAGALVYARVVPPSASTLLSAATAITTGTAGAAATSGGGGGSSGAHAVSARTAKFLETELTCVDATTGRAEGLGELKGGMVFAVSAGLARRLLAGEARGGVGVLRLLGERVAFEVCVGRNGKVWVDAGEGDGRATAMVGRALQEVDERRLDEEGQRKLVARLLREYDKGV